MNITLGELRQLIAEWINPIPRKEEIQARLQDCRYDADERMRLMAFLQKKFPQSSTLLIGSLNRECAAWATGKISFGRVLNALDALYSSMQRKKPSYTSGKTDSSRF